MESPSADVPPHKDSVESMLVWIRQKPHMYAVLVGELDSMLCMLHIVWARLANREQEYSGAQLAVERNLLLSDDKERAETISDDTEAFRRVMNYWEEIDDRLDIQERTDAWFRQPEDG